MGIYIWFEKVLEQHISGEFNSEYESTAVYIDRATG